MSQLVSDAALLQLQEQVEAITHEEYYRVFVKIMNRAENEMPTLLGDRYPPFQVMMEQSLLHGSKIIEDILGAMERHARVSVIHKEKLRAVLLWKQEQLRTHAKVFGNPN